ncbi:MAG: family 10 glycosylhydrolase [Clostridia bacterium]|nr:family 10 glycosylhydrolase [Clostridia bacterium]
MYKGDWRPAVAVVCCAALLCGCRSAATPPPVAVTDTTVRGVWLSYIELDEMLTGRTPQEAARAIDQAVEVCVQNGLNTLFFHVRAHADAYFPSAVWEPAAAARTLLADGFDPLACAVDAAHARGIALHAWLNPYRIGSAPADGDCFIKNGVWYYQPNSPQVRQNLLEGVREILDTYAVDGIHFDDYFYPAGMAPDGEPFETIPKDADVTLWRQTQVDTLISGVYGLCRQRGRLFGVSPAADIDKNRTQSYADVARWMAGTGYIDYVCPQLYVGFRHQTKPFLSLLEEWRALPRREGVRLYIGLALYKVGLDRDPYAGTGDTEWATDTAIIPRQIEATEKNTDGYVLFRWGNLTT